MSQENIVFDWILYGLDWPKFIGKRRKSQQLDVKYSQGGEHHHQHHPQHHQNHKEASRVSQCRGYGGYNHEKKLSVWPIQSDLI